MRFLVDMGIGRGVAAWLRKIGHDAVHLSEIGLVRLDDAGIFARARAEGRVILTCDLDFAEIVALSGHQTPGILILRMRHHRTNHVIARLSSVLPHASQDLAGGAIVTVEDSRHRVRRLPIGRTD
jgi:predicted nuclease of predicted toxin-antitoxin system